MRLVHISHIQYHKDVKLFSDKKQADDIFLKNVSLNY